MNKIKDDSQRNGLTVFRVPFFASVIVLLISAVASAQFGGGGLGGRGGGLGSRLPGGMGRKAKTDELPGYRKMVIEHESNGAPIVAVKIVGNKQVPEQKIRSKLQTVAGRRFDPETVQADVRELSTSGYFQNVRTYKKSVQGGVEITFEVVELPLIQYVRFVGNSEISKRKLLKRAELKEGEALHRYRVEEAKRRIEEFYKEKGYVDAEVEIQEGTSIDDKGVVFAIHEGKLQRVWKTRFVGNSKEFPDGRLKALIKSKPGPLYYFKGKTDTDQIDADVNTLKKYYRDLGYFNAKVSRTVEPGESGKWLTITFVIDEGQRYSVRDVSVIGASKFTTESLMAQLEMKSGDAFNATVMNRDLNSLRDAYGSHGYIHADIKAEPHFLEEPGVMNLVYNIAEGDQYRVGDINVVIDGDNPHTRRDVVMNRISLSPGDVIDIRKLRDSERRLKASQLFLADPTRGVVPSISVRAPENGYRRADAGAQPGPY
ncbi:MAG: hypothetical protein KDB27_05645 [Planctomycetales bacterium]|nr:hypothetical protein [Planctomycetales bacterium]